MNLNVYSYNDIIHILNVEVIGNWQFFGNIVYVANVVAMLKYNNSFEITLNNSYCLVFKTSLGLS